MPRKMIAIIMKIACILLVLGMFATAVAYAKTPRDQYQNAQESFHDSQNKFQDAKDRFETERKLQNTDELKEALRDYLNCTIDYTIKRLEALQIQAEGPEENGYAPLILSLIHI